MNEPLSPPSDALLNKADSDGDATGWSCLDCPRRLLSWRAYPDDDDLASRWRWKLFCSVCLVAELSGYLYVAYKIAENPFLAFMGATAAIKFLIEIWGQDTPTWVCPGGPVMFFVIYFLIFPGVIYTDGICTQQPDLQLRWGQQHELHILGQPLHRWFGLFLYVFGSVYALSYEVGRFRWKKRDENRGRLHTIGLARYCIHPNYFGDLFTYSGWGLAAGTSCALSMPIGMIVSFVFFVVPNSDAYLAKRYWREWPAYRRETAPLIPGLVSGGNNLALGVLALVACVWVGSRCGEQCSMQ